MALPYLTDPPPGAGCPLGAGGWRIVIDAYYNAAVGARVYGKDLYGSDVFGDSGGVGVSSWVDLTEAVTGTAVTVGTRDGSSRQPVDRIEFDALDEDGTLWDFNPGAFYALRAGVPIRAGLVDPVGVYYPLVTGRIERIADTHDEPPRSLAIDGTGMLSDLVVERIDITRPVETVGARAAYYLNLAPWTWSPIPTFPTATTLLADPDPDLVEIRGMLDRVARSAGVYQSTDRRGAWRYEEWPILARPVIPPIVITDCADRGWPFSSAFSLAFDHGLQYVGDLQSAAIEFVEDRSALLNVVQMTNTSDPPTGSVTLQDEAAMATHGVVSNTYDFPWTDLFYTSTADATPIAERALNRFRNMTARIESFTFDSAQDARWIKTVATLEVGTAVTVNRDEITPRTYQAIIVGYVLSLDRNRIRGTAYLQKV